MKRYRWNPRKFVRNMASFIGIILISFILAYGLLWGFSKEAEVQNNKYHNFVK